MKSLQDALVDYDIAHLQSLAYKRGLKPPQARNRETLKTFATELLSPVSMAIALDDLSADECEALNKLNEAGGALEARKFARVYGPIRAMGPNKLLREKPWESPANPAEGLWYRALIFKGFHHTISGPEEIVFIPTEVQAALPGSATADSTFQVSLSTVPAHIYRSLLPAREDLFSLLVYLQANFVRLGSDNVIPKTDRQTIISQFLTANPVDDSHNDGLQTEIGEKWFEFILHLARRLDFLRKQGRRLKLHSLTVRDWLQKSKQTQVQQLQNVWRNDPTWNDLWHIPGLYPKATGWENSPMLGRSKVLHYLAQTPAEAWINIETFIKAVKKTEADFQRPDGDYQTWYLYDGAGNALMGFEHWDDVEGVFIRYILTVMLFSFGVVELGASASGLPSERFKITPPGWAFLLPDKSNPLPPEPEAAAIIRINPADFTMLIPAGMSLYDRFQLARFAGPVRRDAAGVTYQISRKTYSKAIEQSISAEQVLAFLNRITHARVPLPLLEAIRNWDRRTGSVKLERLTVLRVNDKSMLSELLNHPQIGPLLDAPLGPTAILVPEKNVSAVQGLLMELGYWGDIGY